MNIKDYRIISEKNVFRRIAALLTTLLLVITAIPEGFSTAITSVAEAADTAVTGAYFDTDGMEIVTYNVVNDFGADNTGNAMTEKQIQQALDAAQENSGHGIFTKVVIPKGTYLISSALVVYSDTWIYCEEGVEIKGAFPMDLCSGAIIMVSAAMTALKMLSLRAGFGTETQISGQIPQIFQISDLHIAEIFF